RNVTGVQTCALPIWIYSFKVGVNVKKIIETNTENETKEIAEQLGNKIIDPILITLEGDLGAGKTTFTKGLGKGLGVERVITSPTFTIIKEYKGRLQLYHIDYSEEDLGIDEYILSEAVTVIERAKFIEDILPKNKLMIQINYLGSDKREIIFETEDSEIESLLLNLLEGFKGEK